MQNPGGYGHSDSVVKIKSLPFDANQLDIIKFFEGFKLKPNGVQLVVRSDNKPTGEVGAGLVGTGAVARSPDCAAPLCLGKAVDLQLRNRATTGGAFPGRHQL